SKGLLNVGLKDQLVAMEWVQWNIGYFGGDKDKAKSAGAISLGTLMLNRDLSKLARAMIVQSGAPSSIPAFDPLSGQALWDKFVAVVSPNCTHKHDAISSCLAHSDESALLSAISATYQSDKSSFPWVPVLDGPEGVLPDLPSKLYARGKGVAKIARNKFGRGGMGSSARYFFISDYHRLSHFELHDWFGN
ncbi:Carboxylesterase family-domain-containing protein, partial [Mycena floridula]